MTTYKIKDWDAMFECSQSRKIKGNMTWFACPTRQDGKAYRRLISQPGGAEAYGIFIALCAVAAKCPTRGILHDGDRPLDIEDLSMQTGIDAKRITKAVETLSSDRIGWLVAEWERSGSTLPDRPTVLPIHNRTIQNNTEQNNESASADSCGEPRNADSPPPPVDDPVLFEIPTTGKDAHPYQFRQSKLDEYADSYPGVNVLAIVRQARQWCIDNPSKRKTPRGTPGFLTRWINRSIDSGKAIGATNNGHNRKARVEAPQGKYDGTARKLQGPAS